MKLSHIIAAIALSSALMGCQIEIAMLDDGGIVVTDNTDTDATDDGATDDGASTTDVTLYWSAPMTRINGQALEQGEIGGYEVRYKKTADTQYTTVMINDNAVEQYVIDELENADSYSFEVAAFDTDGVYSQFITAN
jgi:hypothetical protein